MFSKISTFTVAVAALLATPVMPASAQTTKPSAGPVTTLPTTAVAPHNLLLPPPPVTAPPPAFSVTLQNCALVPGDASGAPFSIGMASAFNINTNAQPGPASGLWSAGQVGTGTIQFVAGNNLADAARQLPRSKHSAEDDDHRCVIDWDDRVRHAERSRHKPTTRIGNELFLRLYHDQLDCFESRRNFAE